MSTPLLPSLAQCKACIPATDLVWDFHSGQAVTEMQAVVKLKKKVKVIILICQELLRRLDFKQFVHIKKTYIAYNY